MRKHSFTMNEPLVAFTLVRFCAVDVALQAGKQKYFISNGTSLSRYWVKRLSVNATLVWQILRSLKGQKYWNFVWNHFEMSLSQGSFRYLLLFLFEVIDFRYYCNPLVEQNQGGLYKSKSKMSLWSFVYNPILINMKMKSESNNTWLAFFPRRSKNKFEGFSPCFSLNFKTNKAILNQV